MELKLEFRCTRTGRTIDRHKVPLSGPASIIRIPHFPNPAELLASVEPRGYHNMSNTIYEMLRYGVKANFVDMDPADGTVRQPVEYIKGFQEGAQTVIEHAEARLLGFIRHIAGLTSYPDAYFPPNQAAMFKDMCKSVLEEWEHFKGGRR